MVLRQIEDFRTAAFCSPSFNVSQLPYKIILDSKRLTDQSQPAAVAAEPAVKTEEPVVVDDADKKKSTKKTEEKPSDNINPDDIPF